MNHLDILTRLAVIDPLLLHMKEHRHGQTFKVWRFGNLIQLRSTDTSWKQTIPFRDALFWALQTRIYTRGWNWGFFYNDQTHKRDRVFVQHTHDERFSGGIAKFDESSLPMHPKELMWALARAYLQACEVANGI